MPNHKNRQAILFKESDPTRFVIRYSWGWVGWGWCWHRTWKISEEEQEGIGHPVSPALAQFLQTEVTSWSIVRKPVISKKFNFWKTMRISPLHVSRWALNIKWLVSRRKQIFPASSLNLTYPFRSAPAEATGWLRIFIVMVFSPRKRRIWIYRVP